MSRRRHRRRLAPLIGVVVGAVVVIAAVVYALRPDSHVSNAGQVTGFTPPPVVKLVRALWIGDSYTAAAGADRGVQSGEACLTSNRLGWECAEDAESATAYVGTGHIINKAFLPLNAARVAKDKEHYSTPDYVVIDLGRNDIGLPEDKERPAIDAAFTALSKAWPNSRIVVITPYFIDQHYKDFNLAPLRKMVNSEVRAHHFAGVDPIGQGWINSTSAKLVASDGEHPNQAGHTYLAAHLAPAITAALRTTG